MTHNAEDYPFIVDRSRQRLITPGGTVIPFFIARLGIAFVIVTAAAIATIGIPIWVLIPITVWVATHLMTETAMASYRNARTPTPTDTKGPNP